MTRSVLLRLSVVAFVLICVGFALFHQAPGLSTDLATTNASTRAPAKVVSSGGERQPPHRHHADDTGNTTEPEATRHWQVSRAVLPAVASLSKGAPVVIPLPDGRSVRGTTVLVTQEGGWSRVGGSIEGSKGSFTLAEGPAGLYGTLLRPDFGEAFEISPAAPGFVSVVAKPFGDAVCFVYPAAPEYPEAVDATEMTAVTPLAAAVPTMNSRPGAGAVLYLDFDGETVTDPAWNNGNTIVAEAANLNTSQIEEVWRRVREDFLPFNLNVTTDLAKYNSAAVGRRMRVIITPTSSWHGTAGGVAYVNSFSGAGTTFSQTIPCWVFNSSVSGIADSISHEAGHTLGLRHDGRTSPAEEYFSGHGYGDQSWGPIMGAPYGVRLVQWSKGDYANANNFEDDLAKISGSLNGFGYASDDVGDGRDAATALPVSGSNIVPTVSVIHSASDIDYFSLTIPDCTLTLYVQPYSYGSLDASIQLEDGSGNVLQKPASTSPGATINLALKAGTYYIRVRGDSYGDIVGNGYITGYPTYASIGEYTISGSLGAPPAKPSILTHPQSKAYYEGQDASLYVDVNGTWPFSYQWRKNGANIPGATSYYYYISNLALSSAGSYSVVVTNAAGSTTSNDAVITVGKPPAPSFSSQPSDTTRVEGEDLYLYAYADSVVSVTYQWYKDDVAIGGMTSAYLTLRNLGVVNAGKYKLVATNTGGSTSTREVIVTVTPATVPIFSSNPTGAEVEEGESFSLYGYATSNAPINYQWYKDGVALKNATYSSYYGYNAKFTDTGNYMIVATTRAGSAESTPARIEVVTAKPPRILYDPVSTSAAIGDSVSLSVSAQSSLPLVYQWYRNGVAIAGATGSYYSFTVQNGSEFGEYYAKVTNSKGSADSAVATLNSKFSAAAAFQWVDRTELNGIAYFLIRNPARIARYDIVNRAWLTDWTLPYVPTAFAIDSSAVFVASSRSVTKYGTDFTSPQTWANAGGDIKSIHLTNTSLIVTSVSVSYGSLDITTYSRSLAGSSIASKPIYGSLTGLTYSTTLAKLFGAEGYSGRIVSLEVSDGGTIGASTSTPSYSGYGYGYKTFLLSNQSLVTTEAGSIFDGSTLEYQRGAGGQFQDITKLGAEGYLALRGMQLYRLDTAFRDTGSTTTPKYGQAISINGEDVFVFGQPLAVGQNPSVDIIPLSTVVAPAPVAPVNPVGHKYTPAAIMMDPIGTIYLYSQADRNVFRWSFTSNRYRPSIPLSSRSRFMAYAAGAKTLYFDNGGKQIKKIDVSGTTFQEQPYFSASNSITGLQTAGNIVFYNDVRSTWSSHYTIDANGNEVDRVGWNYYSQEYVWCAQTRRMYFMRQLQYPNDLHSEKISVDGEISDAKETPYHSSNIEFTYPIRVSPNGSVVLLGSGTLYDGEDLTYLGALSNTVSDGAWAGTSLHTARSSGENTVLQSWSATTYLLQREKTIEGLPIRMFTISDDKILVITSVNQILNFWKISAQDLSVISRSDGTATPVPDTSDFNGDGYADLIWQSSSTGERGVWMVGQSGVNESISFGNLNNQWAIRTIGDLTADGKPDLVVQNTETGESGVWATDGTARTTFTSFGVSGISWKIVALGDFNADGSFDLVWQHQDSGVAVVWFMNGTARVGSGSFESFGAGWRVWGAGDFNGDGNSDLVLGNGNTVAIQTLVGTTFNELYTMTDSPAGSMLVGVGDYNKDGLLDMAWQVGSRAPTLWLMDGTAILSTGQLSGSDPEREIPSDFNGDGNSDVLWRNAVTGDYGYWSMDGTTVTGYIALGNAGPNWRIAAIGDFNQDSRADILWRNVTSGGLGIALFDGSIQSGYVDLGSTGENWIISGTTDFDGDGKVDVIWRNRATGDFGVWLMNGTAVSAYQSIGSSGPNWFITGAGDFNSDGKGDLIWRNYSAGALGISLMNGAGQDGYAELGSSGPNWEISMVGDFNGDGTPDIVWRNLLSGETGVWLMNGTSTTGYVYLGSSGPNWQIAK